MSKIDPEKQRRFALEVVERLRAAGFTAYWAGGCVRDQLLGLQPKDFDVATDAPPDDVRKVFGRGRTLPLGAAFGVITVLGPRDAGQIEVATFRQEAAYSDGRHPDAVAFSSPEEDAKRRDFTINGLFYDPVEQRVIDYVGGQDDLERELIRAIGEPRERFAEDKLRMLRAVRFSATFGFQLDPATKAAIEEMADQVVVVSAERIAAEMRLMLTRPGRAGAVVLLRDVGLLEVILPEMPVRSAENENSGIPSSDAWAFTLEVLEHLQAPELPLALEALLHRFVLPETIEAICRRWRLSNRESERARWLVAHHSALVDARSTPWPKLQRLLVSEGIDDLLRLDEAILEASHRTRDDLEYCRLMLRQSADVLNPRPLLTGDDLIAHGIPRGKIYQWLLERVRDAQLEEKIHSRAEALTLVDQLVPQYSTGHD